MKILEIYFSFRKVLSKMVTGTQMLTAWAPGIRDLAETLEAHLAEVKHKEELKLQHPEPLACGSLLLYDTLKEQVGYHPDTANAHRPARQPAGTPATTHHRRAPAPPDTSSQPA
jgi:hypothetical protein